MTVLGQVKPLACNDKWCILVFLLVITGTFAEIGAYVRPSVWENFCQTELVEILSSSWAIWDWLKGSSDSSAHFYCTRLLTLSHIV